MRPAPVTSPRVGERRGRSLRAGAERITGPPSRTGLRQVCCDVASDLSLMGATITVMAPHGVEASAAASGPAVEALAKFQFDLGEGPAGEVFRLRRPVLIEDLTAAAGRWVAFAPAALARGVSGVYAFPLSPGAAPLGVLTCYRAGGDPLGAAQLRRCLTAAEDATSLLLSPEGGGTPPAEGGAAPGAGLVLRTVVYQAQGMVAVRLGTGLGDAMAVLRATAYAEEVDLNDLAADLVAGRRGLPAGLREQG